MFGDWHLPASFTDFTVHLWHVVLLDNTQHLHKLLNHKTEEVLWGSDTWHKHRCRGKFLRFCSKEGFCYKLCCWVEWNRKGWRMEGRADCQVRWCLMPCPYSPLALFIIMMSVFFQEFSQSWKFTTEALSFHTACQYIMFSWLHAAFVVKSLNGWKINKQKFKIMRHWTWCISKAVAAAEDARHVPAWKVQTQQLDELISSSPSLSFEACSNMLSVLWVCAPGPVN